MTVKFAIYQVHKGHTTFVGILEMDKEDSSTIQAIALSVALAEEWPNEKNLIANKLSSASESELKSFDVYYKSGEFVQSVECFEEHQALEWMAHNTSISVKDLEVMSYYESPQWDSEISFSNVGEDGSLDEDEDDEEDTPYDPQPV